MKDILFLFTPFAVEAWRPLALLLPFCLVKRGMLVLHLPEFFHLPLIGRRSAIIGPLGMIIRYRYLSDERRSNFINHEKIHHLQWIECGFILFPVIFFFEFIIYSVIFRDLDKGYAFTAFEQEAYTHENDYLYLKKRKPFSWIKFLFRKRKIWKEKFEILSENFPTIQLQHLALEGDLV